MLTQIRFSLTRLFVFVLFDLPWSGCCWLFWFTPVSWTSLSFWMTSLQVASSLCFLLPLSDLVSLLVGLMQPSNLVLVLTSSVWPRPCHPYELQCLPGARITGMRALYSMSSSLLVILFPGVYVHIDMLIDTPFMFLEIYLLKHLLGFFKV